MSSNVRYASWFAGDGDSCAELPASPPTLAYEGFALVATVVGHDCQEHALERVQRAAASASIRFGQEVGDATRSFLELIYQPERPVDPKLLLAEPDGLLALRHVVAFMYAELDGGSTRGLTAQALAS